MQQFYLFRIVSWIKCFGVLLLLQILVRNYSFSQVNFQTGSAVFSLPMFNWQDDKSRLNSVVALSYNSGNGLKVNEVASNIGQGWNLVAGGVISRMQMGEPDDQKEYHQGSVESDYDLTKYPAGYLYAQVVPTKGCPVALTNYPIYEAKNVLYAQHNTVAEDKQPDYFSFQFNGKVGMFVLNPSGDKGISLGDNRLMIEFQRDESLESQQIRTTITSFAIHDVDGLVYKFSKHGLTKVLEAGYCDPDLSYKNAPSKLDNGEVYHKAAFENSSYHNPYIISNWYLTEIKDPLTNRIVTINYYTPPLFTRNVAGNEITLNQGSSKSYIVISHKVSIAKMPQLSSITYPDDHAVLFNYGQNRVDLNGDQVLSSVDIKYKNRFLSKYNLNTTYFIQSLYGTPQTPDQKRVARLCLKSVQKIGVDLKEDTQPYIFDYYFGSNDPADQNDPDNFVPPPFFYAKDVWGFYNGSYSISPSGQSLPLNTTVSNLSYDQLRGLCFLNDYVSGIYLNPKNKRAQAGLLRQIIYPTGGTLTYDYAQNSGVINGTNRTVGGVHVSQTSSTDGGYSNGCSNPIVTHYNYINADGSSSLWGLETPLNSVSVASRYNPEYKDWHWSFGNIFGTCYYHFMYPGILSQREAVNLEGFQKFMNDIGPALGVISTVTTIADVLNLIFVSSGVFAWVAVVVDIVAGIFSLAFTCLHNYSNDDNMIIYYNADLNAASPLPTQFKRVEVTEGSGGSSPGKTVQQFTSDDDYPIWEPLNPMHSTRQRFAPWAYGLPKLTTMYKSDGVTKVKETENVYNFDESVKLKDLILFCKCSPPAGLPYTNFVSARCSVKSSSSQRSTTWSNPASYDPSSAYTRESIPEMDVDIFGFYTGRVELKKTYERVYGSNSSVPQETVSEYSYNQSNYEISQVSSKQSNGDVNYKFISYNEGYADPLLQNLVGLNILSLPVETTTAVVKANSSNGMQYLNERVTEYTQTANGSVKPARILERRFGAPTATNSFYQGPGSNTASLGFKQVQVFSYDPANSNLKGLKDEGGHTVSNIYDYDNKYITASVINADPDADQCAYTSFEADSWGNWSLSGTTIFHGFNGVTGSLSLSLNNGTLTAPINASKPYKLSFWATNNNSSVSGGASLVKSAPAISGFTYYEYDVPQGVTSVSVSGNALIDELRLYPKAARMRTVTYDPLIGKTSECDENNRITYYEYDNLGRTRFIRDEYRNIVKMYEYNNVSRVKQNGCPTVYYNREVTQFFTKSNCAAGYQGMSATFTVPANKYQSSISQDDADLKAEMELNTDGQATADNLNAGTSCKAIWSNQPQQRIVTTEGCPAGSVAGQITYQVPAGRYFSLIDQQDANSKAVKEMDANAQAYANSPEHAVCTSTTDQQWSYKEGDPVECRNVNGEQHLFVWQTDINPNSSSYQTGHTWTDVGTSSACTTASQVSVGFSNSSGYQMYVELQNTVTGQYYYLNCCNQGSVTSVNVPQGVYSFNIYSLSSIPNFYYMLDGGSCLSQPYATYGGSAQFYGVDMSSCTVVEIQVY